MHTFWQTLQKPFFVMAPMADVTDPAFRALVASCSAKATQDSARPGGPDVYWTEFVSADGLYHTREIAKMRDEDNPLMRDLQKSDAERPIVCQIFSNKPEMITYAVTLAAELGFDGVDLNMGCPDRSIEKQGSGAAMIKTPDVARAVIRAAKAASSLPVSVKTRVGYNIESINEWLPVVLEEAPAAVTVHVRTRKQLSLVPADWELMKKVVALRNRINPDVRIIGNGDVETTAQGKRLIEEAGCDGAMIGRGMFGNPWVFAGRSREDTPLTEKLAALAELAHGFERLTPKKNFSILKKHVKAFVTGFDGAAELRAELMAAENATDIDRIIAFHARP